MEVLRLKFFDVGQGDTIAATLPSRISFIMDLCDAIRVFQFLDEEDCQGVVLFLTHTDRDHIRAVREFLAGCGHPRLLGIFCNRDKPFASPLEYRRMLQMFKTVQKDAIDLGFEIFRRDFNTSLNRDPIFRELFPMSSPVTLRIVHPAPYDQDGFAGKSTNECSGVLLIEHDLGTQGTKRILLTGDIESGAMASILDRERSGGIRADVLKYPHHGAWLNSESSSVINLEFIRAVAPRTVVLSVGFSNTHGHVKEGVFNLLEEYSRETGRLESIKCTQFTETCLCSSSLPLKGELSLPHCAGDIEISTGAGVGEDGISIKTNPLDHDRRLLTIVRGSGSPRCAFLSHVKKILSTDID